MLWLVCIYILAEMRNRHVDPPIAQLVEHATVDVITPNLKRLDDGNRGVMGSTPIGRTFVSFGCQASMPGRWLPLDWRGSLHQLAAGVAQRQPLISHLRSSTCDLASGERSDLKRGMRRLHKCQCTVSLKGFTGPKPTRAILGHTLNVTFVALRKRIMRNCKAM